MSEPVQYFPTEGNSPFSPSGDEWISDFLGKSAPMTSTNSFESLNFAMAGFEPGFQPTEFSSVLENDSVFSSSSRSSTASSTPPIKEEEDEFGMTLLNSVSSKLQMMQKRNDLTPRALESIFDTKDVLKDSVDTPVQKYQYDFLSKRKRSSRKRLTETQKEAHNKVEKKYRVNINAKINCLQTVIPWLRGDQDVPFDAKVNKSVILEKAYDYIVHLQAENGKLKGQLEK